MPNPPSRRKAFKKSPRGRDPGSKGYNLPAIGDAENGRKYSHPAEDPERDGRIVAFVNNHKDDKIMAFLEGSPDLTDTQLVKAFKFTRKELSTLMRSDDFRMYWETKILEATIGSWIPTREQWAALKYLGLVLGFAEKGGKINISLKAIVPQVEVKRAEILDVEVEQ